MPSARRQADRSPDSPTSSSISSSRNGPSSGELSASRRRGGPSPPTCLVSDGGSSTITVVTLAEGIHGHPAPGQAGAAISAGAGGANGSSGGGGGAISGSGANGRNMWWLNCLWNAPPPPTRTPPPSPEETGVPSGSVAAVWPPFQPTLRAPGSDPYRKPRASRARSILPVLNRSP